MQGNCTSALPPWAHELLASRDPAWTFPSHPGTCAIAVGKTFLRNAPPFGNTLNLNHLHIVLDRNVHNAIDNVSSASRRLVNADTAVLDVPLIEWNGDAARRARAWIENCTFQGDHQPGSMGIRSSGGMFCLRGVFQRSRSGGCIVPNPVVTSSRSTRPLYLPCERSCTQ